MYNFARSLLLITAISTLPALIHAEDLPAEPAKTLPSATSIGDLSIEELLNIKITSASKKLEKASETASAIYVITQEDIRRMGVTSIAEAIRMAPGMNVSQVGANTWAISGRGFASTLANKLLVLIDGRSVYTPLYSGVYWDAQDTMLEDIERIEIIRGPGATVWGANAVNGVVNVITRDSKDTQGGLASASAGTTETTIDSVRYGGKIGEKITYRAFLKYQKREELSLAATDNAAHDGWDKLHGGTRFDFTPTKEDKILVEGDYYAGTHEEKPTVVSLTPPFSQRITHDASFSGGDVLSRWSHAFSEGSESTLQVYYDHTERKELVLHQAIDTYDIDFNHHLKLQGHEFVFGAGYRRVREDLHNNFFVSFMPPDRKTNLFSAFAQDEIEVIKDKFSITLGSKFEHNDYTEYEVQPSIKTLWNAAKGHTVWSSVSRAVRTPAPIETDLRLNAVAGTLPPPASTPVLISLVPNRDIPSETVISSELGYRAELHKRFSIDVAGFYNVYDNLRSVEAGKSFPEATPTPAHLTLPLSLEPDMNGLTYGGEFSANWRPIDRMKFSMGYSLLKVFLSREDRAKATNAEAPEGQSPENQFHIRSYIDLPHRLQFDTALYFVDQLESLNVPSYARMDARLGWRPTDNFDLSIGGQNLARREHVEFAPQSSKIERNVYIKATLKF